MVDQKDILKWIEALRSGDFQQGTGRLEGLDGFCCLGVACAIFIPQGQQRRVGGFLAGELPHSQFAAPMWLRDLPTEFAHKAHVRLQHLNDTDRLTFDEIADVLQAVYIEKVLD